MANLKSPILDYFNICATDSNKALCKLCTSESSQKYIVRGKSAKSQSTTPLWNHLQFKHNDIYLHLKNVGSSSKEDDDDPQKQLKEDKPSQLTLESAFMRTKKWSLEDSRSKTITSKICELMALDAEPFAIVEREGFSELIKHLAPRYPLPGRKYFQNKALPELYEKTKSIIQIDINEAIYMSFTTDIWTSSANNESFISLTAHFLNHEMKQKTYALNCKHFPVSHTGSNIAEIIRSILDDWQISADKQHVIVRDNAANITLGTGLLTTLDNVSCFIHSLQLVINDLILTQRSVIDIISKSRKIVGHFSHSSLATTSLKEIQKNLKLPQNKLVQDVSTRWNSTYYTLKTLYEQRQAVTAYAAETDIPTLTVHQWTLVENVIRVLQPFEEITKEASSDKEIISSVIPSIMTLKTYLSKRQKDEGIQTLKEALKEALINRFLNHCKLNVQDEKIFCVATTLDPRFKFCFFDNPDKVKKWIISELKDNTEMEKEEPIPEIDEKSLSEETHEDIWSCFTEIISENTKSDNQITLAAESEFKNEELDKYINSPLIKRNEDPLLWWKNNINKYQNMKPLILKYLSTPPSSAISERLFSSAKQIYTENRNRLKPENAEMLLFIMRNMKVAEQNK